VLAVTIGNRFPSVGEILPSAFSVEQYFPNIGETISNSDLNASHYLLAKHPVNNAVIPTVQSKLSKRKHTVQITSTNVL